jgi:cytochrome c oxidase subunit 2
MAMLNFLRRLASKISQLAAVRAIGPADREPRISPFRVSRQKATAIVAAAAAGLLAGCSGMPSALAPASTNATLTYQLILIIFGIAAVVFVVVEGMLIYAAIRFSRRPADEQPSQVEGNRRLEIAWTLAPAIVLAIVFVVSLRTLWLLSFRPTLAPGTSNDPQALHVHVVGHQWWWEFDYTDEKFVTATELHVPVGAVVDLSLESADVIHSFWVPQLGGKIDVIPGHVNQTWFQVVMPGTYHGQCAEFCGVEHADMRFDVVAESPDQFQAWVKQQQTPLPPMTGDAAQGEQVFMNGPCVGCHTIDGTKAQGKVGPNLTHFATRHVFAGGILDNTPANVATWLGDPQKVKPGNVMPNLHLSTQQIDALVAFLESTK